MIYILACILILSLSSVLNKHAIKHSEPFAIQLTNGIVSTILLPVWYYFIQNKSDIFNRAATPFTITAAGLSSLGFVCLLMAFKEWPASTVTALLSVYPVLVYLFSVFIGTESFSLIKAFGVVLIISGICVVKLYG